MPTRWRPRTLLVCGLLLIASSACAGGSATSQSAPAVQRRGVTTTASNAASPVVVSQASNRPAPSTPVAAAPQLRLPPDGQEVVVVDSTNGEGVWVRRQPAGEPIRIWPDGSPMLVAGQDRLADGRVWRNVSTLDGQVGWVAAEFVLTVDPSMLAATMPDLADLVSAAVGTPSAANGDLQARLAAVGGATPTPQGAGVAPAASRLAAQPPAGFAGQSLALPTAATVSGATATPQPAATPPPTATPIKAPPGATSIDVGQTTMSVGGAQRGVSGKIGGRPRDGMELLAVQVRVANRGDTPFALYRGAFRLALSDRTRVEPLAGGPSPLPYSTEVAPGDTQGGTLTFEVPTGTRVDGLIWAPERDVAYAISVPS